MNETYAETLLFDPFLNNKKVQPFVVKGLNKQEAYAEKTRAALCRKELAIRDYYDLDYACTTGILDLNSQSFIELVKKKIKNETYMHDLTEKKTINLLRSKINSELVPTLKTSGIVDFSLSRITEKLSYLTDLLGNSLPDLTEY